MTASKYVLTVRSLYLTARLFSASDHRQLCQQTGTSAVEKPTKIYKSCKETNSQQGSGK